MNRMIDGINNSATTITLGHVGACRRRVCVSFWRARDRADRVSNEMLGEEVP